MWEIAGSCFPCRDLRTGAVSADRTPILLHVWVNEVFLATVNSSHCLDGSSDSRNFAITSHVRRDEISGTPDFPGPCAWGHSHRRHKSGCERSATIDPNLRRDRCCRLDSELSASDRAAFIQMPDSWRPDGHDPHHPNHRWRRKPTFATTHDPARLVIRSACRQRAFDSIVG